MQTAAHVEVRQFFVFAIGTVIHRGLPLSTQKAETLLHDEGAADAQASVVLDGHGRIPHRKDGVPDILDKCAIADRRGRGQRDSNGVRLK